MEKVREDELRTLIDVGAVQGVRIIGDGDRWYAIIHVGSRQRVLGSHRRQRREFSSLDRFIARLRSLGIGRVEVDATHHSRQKALA